MSEEYDRREFLKKMGVGAMGFTLVPLGLAGCGGGEEEELSMDNGGSSKDSGGSDGSDSSGSQQDHETPHPADDELADAEATGTALNGAERSPGGKQPKDSPGVMYQHKPNGDKSCGNCTMYVPDQNDDGFGACTNVDGKIHPCDYCILYTQSGSEDAVACG